MTDKHSQRGAVLIIALVFLSVMATLAASSMQSSTVNERLAGNIRDRSAAFQAAEATLRAAEQSIATIADNRFTQKSNSALPTVVGQYPATITVSGVTYDSWRYIDTHTNASGESLWLDGTAVNLYDTADTYLKSVLSDPPSYIIEEIESLSDSIGVAPPVVNTYYRITARAVGISENSEVVLQTTFKK